MLFGWHIYSPALPITIPSRSVPWGKEMGQWSNHTEGNSDIEKRGFSGSSPEGKLTKPSRQPSAIYTCECQVLGTEWGKSRWSWGLSWQKLVCFPWRYQMSHFPEHGAIQAAAEDTVTTVFSHNFLQKSPFLLTTSFCYQYFSCSLAVLLPLFNF